MGKSPLILAALAKDAVPELDFSRVEALVGDGESRDFEVALLTSNTGEHYVLREPKNHAGFAKIAIEVAISKALGAITGLSFKVPTLLGETRDPRVEKAYLFDYVYGYKIDPHAISPNSNLAARIGEVIAEIHGLPSSLVEENGLPEYSVAEIVKSRVAELDRALATGRIPAVLANRWERALEDVAIFRFSPTVVHGDMNGDHMLELNDSVESVMSWSSLKVSDPAEDFAWLMSGTDDDVVYQVLLAYSARRQSNDQNLRVRAMLYSEMLVARWLMHGQSLGDEGIVEEALDMLAILAEDVTEGRLPALSPAEISARGLVAGSDAGLGASAGNAFLAEAESPVSSGFFAAETAANSSPLFQTEAVESEAVDDEPVFKLPSEQVSDKTRPIEIIEVAEVEIAQVDYDYGDETGQVSTQKPPSDELF